LTVVTFAVCMRAQTGSSPRRRFACVNDDERVVMFRAHRRILAGLVGALAGATCLTGVASAAAWTKLATLNPLTGPSDWNTFNAVTRPATNDGWAGGYEINWPKPYTDQFLLEHWDGTGWSVHATPKALGSEGEIAAMSSAGPDDVWAVGAKGNLAGDAWVTFAMHWNGSSWKVVPTPSIPPADLGSLGSVAVRNQNDAWATGATVNGALLEHWNGSTWSTVAGAPGSDDLIGVTTAAHGVVWAVGSEYDGNTGVTKTFAEHLVNGTWVRTPTPNPLNTGDEDVNELHSVTALSQTDAWAVGMVGNEDADEPYRPLILHWDGTAWHRVAAPSPDAGGDPLAAVLARSAKDVWAVGYGGATITTSDTHAVVEHWNGAGWTYASAGPIFFGSIAENPANGRLWAAGYVEAKDHVNALIKAHS